MLSTLAIANYRSLRDLVVPLGKITVVTGPNGSGKSSVYRALRLLAEIARGDVIRSLVREGGLTSTLWAGPERFTSGMRRGTTPIEGTMRKEPVHLRLGFASADPSDFGYAIDIGLPRPSQSAFHLDPEIKVESIWVGPLPRPAALMVERKGASLRAIDGQGQWQLIAQAIPGFASMMTEYADPRGAPEMLTLRERIRSWRFYDHFRTDAEAPARQAQLATFTPVLGNDGSDLAAALQTILEIGDAEALAGAVEDAFPGAEIEIRPLKHPSDGRLELQMQQAGLLRPLNAAELSDGTLRYLLWIAALLTPRPPALLVLNEPETSLHPSLLEPLGRLIAQCARQTQVIVVSHAERLIGALSKTAAAQSASAPKAGSLPLLRSIVLEKELGETRLADFDLSERPRWQWPGR